MTGKPIFVPLAKEPFLKFERGTKTYEIRQQGSPVAKQVCRFDTGGGHPVILSLGYSGRRLLGELGTRYFADRFAGLMTEVRAKADVGDVSGFFAAGRPVVAFEVRNVRPAGNLALSNCHPADSCPDAGKVAALFVSETGPYMTDARFDPWPKDRDARTYAGPHPVVAHPPCERWGRFAKGSPLNPIHKVGDDGGCFAAALQAVRRWGGVIEHPEGSHAFRHFRLPIPIGKGGWSVADAWGGRSCRVDQGAYGHPAKKATWLYAVLPAFPELNHERVWGRPTLARPDGYSDSKARARAKAAGRYVRGVQVDGDWRWRTPEPFKDALHAMAASCTGWQARPRQVERPLGNLEADR